MIDKEELLERIENTLTTRMVKELFKRIVEECEVHETSKGGKNETF